jgi:phosphoserine phosphatase
MQQVCVLISSPEAAAVNDGAVGEARRAIGGDATWRWLSPHVACEIGIDATVDARTLQGRLGEHLNLSEIDLAILPLAHRRKRLLIADMDSTMIEQECIDELADCVGLKDRVAAITERAMRGEIAFEPAVRERVALLKGLACDALDQVARERISLMPGARTLVQTMRANGAYTALVSGGFDVFTRFVAERLGFHVNQANTLEMDGDRLSGVVREPILGRDAKREALRRLLREHGLAQEQSLAVGDGANDLAMLGEAGLGVAFRAKPAVAEAAHARIDHGDLTALLYLQGFTRDEFVD